MSINTTPDTSIDLPTKFRNAGLRLTKQRCLIAKHLFSGGHRHLDAAMLFAELLADGKHLSLATIYNALRDFEQQNLIRRIAVSTDKVWYDTDIGDHRHFYVPAENRIIDCPDQKLSLAKFADPPEGYEVTSIDVVVHLAPQNKS
ncbi:Fur family transcriptional regulator [Pseudovibrio sp. POLY-S9]|uniref:Fur family transcriptional regulator n=1 Tax=Pseudovibrio sp. POLY-S9 TaxID=1576596 RepID=UPI0009EA50FF|nr:Fur family transcriptional regulator [Pseudovibrio sp. POLY-S9]